VTIKLSSREYILLWLLRFLPKKDDFIQSPEVSQKGLSKGLGMRQTNVSRDLSVLRKENIIEQRPSHFHGCKRKMTAYSLTAKGGIAAKEVVSKVERSVVMMEGERGSEEITLGKLIIILKQEGFAPSHFTLARCFDRKKIPVNMDEVRKIMADPASFRRIGKEKKHHLIGVTGRGDFIGRKDVLDRINHGLAAREFQVTKVLGVAGMGKSAIAREVIDYAKKSYHVFYFRFRDWYRFDSFTDELSNFLAEQPVPDGEIFRKLVNYCKERRLFLVMDDVHRIKERMNEFLERLIAHSRELSNLKILLLSRERGGQDDYPCIKEGVRMEEILLPPLTQEECAELASIKIGDPGNVAQEMGGRILEVTGGIPLLVELLRKEDIITGMMGVKGTDLIEKEILEKLGKESARLLKVISLCTLPVEKDIIREGERYVPELTSALLIEHSSDGLLRTHDHIREMVRRGIGFRERKHLTNEIISYLKEVIRRGVEEDYLPAPILEDMEVYYLEYIYHHLEAGKITEALKVLRKKPFNITRGPPSQVLWEFLDRMELKMGHKHGLIEFLRAEISMERGDMDEAKRYFQEMKKLSDGMKKNRKSGGNILIPSVEDVEQLMKRLKDADEYPGKLREMMRDVEEIEHPKERFFSYMTIAAKHTERKESKKAGQWLDKAERTLEELPSPGKAILYLKTSSAHIKLGTLEEADRIAKAGLGYASQEEVEITGALLKTRGKIQYSGKKYHKAEDMFNRAKSYFRRTENRFQLADTMLWEVKSILANDTRLKKAMTTSFLKKEKIGKKARGRLDSCITRIRESLLILRGMVRKTGRLSRLLGREIFDPRNVSLWHQLLVLRCSLEWCGGYEDYALGTCDDIILLGNRTGNTDLVLEGSIIRARILMGTGKRKEAADLLRELERKKIIPAGPGKEILKRTKQLISE